MTSPPQTAETRTSQVSNTFSTKADLFTNIQTKPLTYKERHEADVNVKFKDDGQILDDDTTIAAGGDTFRLGDCRNVQSTASDTRGYILFQRSEEGTCALTWPVTGCLEGGSRRGVEGKRGSAGVPTQDGAESVEGGNLID